MTALLEAQHLLRTYPLPAASLFSGHARLRAVDDVSLTITSGRSLGIVGESGSGKSTLARLVMRLEDADSGTVRMRGEDLCALSPSELRRRRRDFQMVFQDPYGSLDPRQRVVRIVAEPLDVAEPGLSRGERSERVAAVLDAVGLPHDAASRYPHEFSGGQRQRIALARALITAPALIVADEPVSALDVLVQAQVLNLMMDLQEQRGVTYLFISHNLAVVEHIADEVGVMYRGRIVERGPAEDLFVRPAHPYTRALVDAIPDPAAPSRGRPALALREDNRVGGGCAFAPRCPRARARCREEAPALREVGTNRHAACHYPGE
ncbi:MAG TPA: oligopeptide/dipeptide ABC transporter ATP-binding protein [Alphaproteobacteria bacterium]|nr:oligopeptide/dipeptide ABC transporter ATP-binding protein [Alphaproteobacteria bacterium]